MPTHPGKQGPPGNGDDDVLEVLMRTLGALFSRSGAGGGAVPEERPRPQAMEGSPSAHTIGPRNEGPLRGVIEGLVPRGIRQNLRTGPIGAARDFLGGLHPGDVAEPGGAGTAVKGLKALVAPGVPGGPIFRRGEDLVNELEKLPMEDLAQFTELAWQGARDSGRALKKSGLPLQTARGKKGEMPIPFSDDEVLSLETAGQLAILRRAKAGDEEALGVAWNRGYGEDWMDMGELIDEGLPTRKDFFEQFPGSPVADHVEEMLTETLQHQDQIRDLFRQMGLVP